jgi:hypothetical protein
MTKSYHLAREMMPVGEVGWAGAGPAEPPPRGSGQAAALTANATEHWLEDDEDDEWSALAAQAYHRPRGAAPARGRGGRGGSRGGLHSTARGGGRGGFLGRDQCARCRKYGHWKNECPEAAAEEAGKTKDTVGQKEAAPGAGSKAANTTAGNKAGVKAGQTKNG